jgi:hypothetical protein
MNNPQPAAHVLRNAQPNQAVYEEHNPYDGPSGLMHGAMPTELGPVIAVHQNSDGTYAGVTAEGTVVSL